ncbi:MAG: TIGR00730 family Rossman fold protein [Pseudomonadota bacterium]|nr:TIGR00730 family Rossman fold protein [Pseudomonadota bacterium]
MSSPPRRLDSVCVFCGSSNAADPALIAAAASLGEILAREGLRLVYGGGGVGLMGACARATHLAGGRVLGVIPQFLTHVEAAPAGADIVVVASMHERKMTMFEAADAFAVLPGAIGTLEETIELLSWRRLGLHAKPIVFYNPGGFWDPLFALFRQFIDAGLLPSEFADCWRSVNDIADVLPALRAMPATFMSAPGVTALT